jgi:quercetin dioxygenase-like cupin family protein
MQLGDALIIDDLRMVELDHPGASAASVYDRPIGLRLLHEDAESGEEHYLIRYPAGVKGRAHQHTAAHTIVVLEGKLDANDQIIGPGSYAHFPANQPMRHQAGGDEGCLFVIMFHGPFDVDVLDVVDQR